MQYKYIRYSGDAGSQEHLKTNFFIWKLTHDAPEYLYIRYSGDTGSQEHLIKSFNPKNDFHET